MRHAKGSRLQALISLLILLSGVSLFPFVAYSSTCTGSDPCNACKNCKYCQHCAKSGGRCGICK